MQRLEVSGAVRPLKWSVRRQMVKQYKRTIKHNWTVSANL